MRYAYFGIANTVTFSLQDKYGNSLGINTVPGDGAYLFTSLPGLADVLAGTGAVTSLLTITGGGSSGTFSVTIPSTVTDPAVTSDRQHYDYYLGWIIGGNPYLQLVHYSRPYTSDSSYSNVDYAAELFKIDPSLSGPFTSSDESVIAAVEKARERVNWEYEGSDMLSTQIHNKETFKWLICYYAIALLHISLINKPGDEHEKKSEIYLNLYKSTKGLIPKQTAPVAGESEDVPVKDVGSRKISGLGDYGLINENYPGPFLPFGRYWK